jgi:hypothetical protein
MSRRFELLTASPELGADPTTNTASENLDDDRPGCRASAARHPAPAGPRIPDSRRGRICAGHWPRLVPVGSCQIAACELAAGPSAVRTRLRGTASDQPAPGMWQERPRVTRLPPADRHRNLELVARFTAKPTGDTTTVATTDPNVASTSSSPRSR